MGFLWLPYLKVKKTILKRFFTLFSGRIQILIRKCFVPVPELKQFESATTANYSIRSEEKTDCSQSTSGKG